MLRLDRTAVACHPSPMDVIQSKAGRGRVADAPNRHWVYRLLPRAVWPYAQLARWDRPIGWWLLLWPCWWSAALAAVAFGRPGEPLLSLLPEPEILALFWVGAVAMRGAGCTYNDIVDAHIDASVERTRSRPLPSGQVSKRAAWVFLVAQALVGLAVLLQFNDFAIPLGLASLAIVATYPFMKRFTDWPQLVLGLAFSWGALMGWAQAFGDLNAPAFLLYAGSVLWVIGYDTIYAHQDKEDDALVGVRSTARLFGDQTKPWLLGLYGGALLCFSGAIAAADAPFPALAGVVAAGAHMMRQVARLDIDNPAHCLTLFHSNKAVGWLIFLGLIGGGLWLAAKPALPL